MNIQPYDEHFMRRCIDLSQESVNSGDAPFGSLIARGETLIAEGLNDYKSKITEHAEIVALNNAHRVLGTHNLSDCTLYTSCEPCPMCSFMIREFKIKRVVFALPSPHMGGFTRWDILKDEGLSPLAPFFSHAPEVVDGFMEQEASLVMNKTPLGVFFGSNAKTKERQM